MENSEKICSLCKAALSELPSAPNITSSGKYTDKAHPNISVKKCECCGREIRIFTQQTKQTKYCPDCQKQREKKSFKNVKTNISQLTLSDSVVSNHSGQKETMIEKPTKQERPIYYEKYFKTFRDCVHGDIDLYEWEVKIVDTPEFQRLRGIKQLGLADLVYPGAVHNRFIHSLGTLHMTQVMIDNINQNNITGSTIPINEPQERIIRLTALLHDIGHLPFGHTLEKECNLLTSHHDDWSRMQKYVGEKTNIGIILGGLGLYNEVTQNLSRLGNEQLQTTLPPYMIDIVGNTICADLLDYLKRDGYACGLNLDYDNRIFKYFAIQDSDLVVSLEKHNQYRRDNVSELLSLLRNRYSLTEKVIFHHSKLAASAMLGTAFQLSGMDESKIWMIGQEEMLAMLLDSSSQRVKDLVTSIKYRKLHKCFFLYSREHGDEEKIAFLNEKLHKDPERRRSIEKRLETKFGLEEGSIIIYCPKSDMAFKPADVKVVYRSGVAPKTLSEIPMEEIKGDVRSLKIKHESLWKMCLFLQENYYYQSTEIAQSFIELMRLEGIILENHFEDRPTQRFERQLIIRDVVENITENHDLPYHTKQQLREYLANHTPSTRLNPNTPVNKSQLSDKYLELAESWYNQEYGKKKA